MHISHNCSICGVAVEEFCGEHPNAIVDSVMVDEARELRSAQVLVDSFLDAIRDQYKIIEEAEGVINVLRERYKIDVLRERHKAKDAAALAAKIEQAGQAG